MNRYLVPVDELPPRANVGYRRVVEEFVASTADVCEVNVAALGRSARKVRAGLQVQLNRLGYTSIKASQRGEKVYLVREH